MKDDTPLAEVAHHLSTDIAGLLSNARPIVAESTLRTLREAVIYLEECGLQLSPMDYQVVVNAIAITVLSLNEHVVNQALELDTMRLRVQAADNLLRGILEGGPRDDDQEH